MASPLVPDVSIEELPKFSYYVTERPLPEAGEKYQDRGRALLEAIGINPAEISIGEARVAGRVFEGLAQVLILSLESKEFSRLRQERGTVDRPASEEGLDHLLESFLGATYVLDRTVISKSVGAVYDDQDKSEK